MGSWGSRGRLRPELCPGAAQTRLQGRLRLGSPQAQPAWDGHGAGCSAALSPKCLGLDPHGGPQEIRLSSCKIPVSLYSGELEPRLNTGDNLLSRCLFLTYILATRPMWHHPVLGDPTQDFSFSYLCWTPGWALPLRGLTRAPRPAPDTGVWLLGKCHSVGACTGRPTARTPRGGGHRAPCSPASAAGRCHRPASACNLAAGTTPPSLRCAPCPPPATAGRDFPSPRSRRTRRRPGGGRGGDAARLRQGRARGPGGSDNRAGNRSAGRCSSRDRYFRFCNHLLPTLPGRDFRLLLWPGCCAPCRPADPGGPGSTPFPALETWGLGDDPASCKE